MEVGFQGVVACLVKQSERCPSRKFTGVFDIACVAKYAIWGESDYILVNYLF